MKCRTCLKYTSPDDLVPLFGGSLPHKIETISSVKVVEDDDLPSMICQKCARNINAAFNFRLIIIHCDFVLKRDNRTETKVQTFENEHSPVEIKSELDDDDIGILNNIPSGSISDKELEQEVHSDSGKIEKAKDNNRLSDVIEYKCNQCDYVAKNYKLLCYHRSTRHLNEPVVCSLCGKTLLAPNMKKHLAAHSSAPVTCKVCGFVSKNADSLRCHMMYHTGQRKVCHICGKVYRHSSKYGLHMRMHMTPREKKHKCHLCEKSFTHTDTLKRHIRSHTGERPYMCEFCKKGFSSPHALKTHKRQHTNERPFACALCPMAFPQKVSLRTHMKSKHCSEQLC